MNIDSVYQSLVYHLSTILPSGITAVDGESYGIDFTDPRGKSPSVAVTMDESIEHPIELGTMGTRYFTTYTISAKSRKQRDVLKSVVYSGITNAPVSLYTAFSGVLPTNPSYGIAEPVTGIKTQDMPNFDTDREKFFWTAIITVTYEVS